MGCLYNPTDTSNPFFGCRRLVLGAQSISYNAALSLWALQLCFLWEAGNMHAYACQFVDNKDHQQEV